MLSLVIVGVGLYEGIFSGGSEFALTIVPAIFGGTVIALGLAFTLVPAQIDRTLERWAGGEGRGRALLCDVDGARRGARPACARRCASCASATAARSERSCGGYFDIAMLWASFHAFGEPPPFAVIVHGVLPRDARQPAAAPGRHRRGRRRDDRRVRGVRRAVRHWRPSRC